jgi:tRNA dimethylallyltransferase
MFDEGLLDEVKRFYDLKINSKALSTAIGYKELYAYFNNEISLEEAKDLIKKNSRHYAKRQYTWFNNQMNVNWFNTNFDNFNETVEEVINFIDANTSK